jgi:hypothetical protein
MKKVRIMNNKIGKTIDKSPLFNKTMKEQKISRQENSLALNRPNKTYKE